MSQTIELPDPLFAEIHGYARSLAVSPLIIITQAWAEFRCHHPDLPPPGHVAGRPSESDLLAMVDDLSGSLSLPSDADYDRIRHAAVLDKYGPL
jgi:hypothetical protein